MISKGINQVEETMETMVEVCAQEEKNEGL